MTFLQPDEQHTTRQIDTFTPKNGDLLMDVNKRVPVLGDGVTKGGNPLVRGGVWEDLNAGGVNLTLAASGQPDKVAINGSNIISYAFDGVASAEELHWCVELPHTYKEGTDLRPHIHLYPTTNAAGNIRFTLEWYISRCTLAPITGSTSVTVAAPEVAWQEIRTEFDDVIDGSDLTIAAQLHFRVRRTPADAADTYAADVALGTIGIHYQKDTLGSYQVFTKGFF